MEKNQRTAVQIERRVKKMGLTTPESEVSEERLQGVGRGNGSGQEELGNAAGEHLMESEREEEADEANDKHAPPEGERDNSPEKNKANNARKLARKSQGDSSDELEGLFDHMGEDIDGENQRTAERQPQRRAVLEDSDDE
ncbi:unnamed protein product [Discosporangium mesarthrocarpum]